jgi:hypothetical protein
MIRDTSFEKEKISKKIGTIIFWMWSDWSRGCTKIKLQKYGHRHVNFDVAAFHALHSMLICVWRVNTQNKNGMTLEA